ncbi:MAG: hypothetical protein HYY00_04620 [Chloroflexi bacterium]|nr:hypothetical protein [Chloroflexota bacterium]
MRPRVYLSLVGRWVVSGLLAAILATLAVACTQAAPTSTPTATPTPSPTPTTALPTSTLTPTPSPSPTVEQPMPTATPTPTPTSPPPTPTPPKAEVKLSEHPELGSILTDFSGRTLYLFTRDERNKSNCSGNCAVTWPPLLSTGTPAIGEGLEGGRLGTAARGDGSMQATYNGWPLYYYAADGKPGDVTGQDVGKAWFVVSTYGGPVQTGAAVNTAQHPELGTILTDASRRTLYLFTRDEPNKSNCSGNCALDWPPLLTVGDPTVGGTASATFLGTITRADGSTQVTYNGWPLYYYAPDARPGDTTGQNVGTVWFVVSATGEAVPAAKAEPTPTPMPPPATGDDGYSY